MAYAVLGGGKRVRPVLALAACQAVSGEAEAALPVGCALELIHAYSLVHDDLPDLDDDAERRGQPTVHVRYGVPTAILTGDALLTEAFRILADPSWGVEPAVQIRAVALVAEAAGAAGMVGGQQYDIDAAHTPPSASEVSRLHAMKTGALFRAAVVGGGLAGGASDDELAALETYGRSVGRAFQLTDDLLDLLEAEASDDGATGDAHEDAVNLAVHLGADAVRAEAAVQIAAALDAVARFGDDGAVLAAIARFIRDRDV
jgi:geranylgeranyl pyrophosphate synthase